MTAGMRPVAGTQKGDVYSFAIIAQELIFRALPYFADRLELETKGYIPCASCFDLSFLCLALEFHHNSLLEYIEIHYNHVCKELLKLKKTPNITPTLLHFSLLHHIYFYKKVEEYQWDSNPDCLVLIQML